MLEILGDAILNMGYLGFFIYMIIVGTFIPLPTQIILIPIGIFISQGELDFTLAVIITTLGTTTGALINYQLSYKISKKFMKPEKVDKLRRFFNKYGKVSLILAPLSFGMGQYISIPAGIAKMDLRWFIPLIFISNLIWNSSMIMLGFIFGRESNSQMTYLLLGGGFILILIISILTYREFKN